MTVRDRVEELLIRYSGIYDATREDIIKRLFKHYHIIPKSAKTFKGYICGNCICNKKCGWVSDGAVGEKECVRVKFIILPSKGGK